MALNVLCGDGRGYDSSASHFVYSSAKLTSGFVPRPLLLQSAFSLKIRVVIVSASATANYDRPRKYSTLLHFLGKMVTNCFKSGRVNNNTD